MDIKNTSTKITSSLSIFTNKLIDYAGLFPPASLGIYNSYSNFLRYYDSPYGFMLSRFIIPSKKLPELADIYSHFDVTKQAPLSVLFTGGDTAKQFIDELKNDIKLVNEFITKHEERVILESFETKLPADLFSDLKGIKEFFVAISSFVEKELKSTVNIFFEAPPDINMPTLIDALTEFNKEHGRSYGYKLRTGGLEASAFPDAGHISTVLKICRNHEVPVKFTAGLHHPLRRYEESVKTIMHGFLNIFTAGIINCTHDINRHEIQEILLDDNIDNFEFHENYFQWKNLVVLNSSISDARKRFLISFGSCSFEEPIEDLKELELL
ncbi:MAG: hypothetical protein EHM58_11220 [Ignavibacteriae bacterium]|nr:MAG: hypothetical protein EHM58_11220 [Ignavibacteriota bacterium]